MRSLLGAALGGMRNYQPAYVSPTTRLSLAGSWLGRGPRTYLNAMGANGTLYSIVNRTSTSLAAVDWQLWRPSPSGDEAERKRILQHAVLDFLARPNPHMHWQLFCEISAQHMDLVGEMWWVIHYGSRIRMPLEMWPVRPDRMEPVPDKNKFIGGYIYTGPNGEKVPLGLDEVVFTRMPNPDDIYRGMGPVQTILHQIDAARYSAEWNRNFFANDASPGGIIEAPEQIGDVEFQTFRDRWDEMHKGVSNTGRVALLEGGWRWVDRKYTQRDMQFVELSTVGRDTIREAYGISKFVLGDVDDVNRATADASAAVYGQWTIMPRAERMRSAIQHGILPKFGAETLEIDYDRAKVVPADRASDDAERTSKATAFKILLDAGVDPLEAAEVCGLPPLKVEKPEPPAIVAPGGGAPPAPGAGRDEAVANLLARALDLNAQASSTGCGHRPRGRRPRNMAAAAGGGGADEDAEGAYAAHQQALAQLIETWATDVTPDQLAQLQEQIQLAVDTGDEAALGALAVDASVAAGILLAAMSAAAAAEAARLAEQAPDAVPIAQAPYEEMAATALATASLLAGGLAVAAGAEALRLAGAGVAGAAVAATVLEYLEGLAGRTLADRLGAALWQAITAARYAVMGAGVTLGLIDGFIAVEINDPNRCEPCEDVDGTRYETLAEARDDYPVIGYADCAGGIRCRGMVAPLWRARGGDA